MIIAIDGPAASGKGTLGKRLAEHYGFAHLDTGLLYRAVARVRPGTSRSPTGTPRQRWRRTWTSTIWTTIPASRAPPWARPPRWCRPTSRCETRFSFQRQFAMQEPGAVLDGQDIGTVVCPDAQVKLFITAAPENRPGAGTGAAEPGRAARIRDHPRGYPPPRRARHEPEHGTAEAAADAITLDTTHLDADGAFRAALDLVEGRRSVPLVTGLLALVPKLAHFPDLSGSRQGLRWFVPASPVLPQGWPVCGR